MDKAQWLQLTKNERVAHLQELLAKLVDIIKVQRDCIRTHAEAPKTDRKKYERQITSIMEWEKEDHD